MNPLGSPELSLAFLVACSAKATILLIFAWIAASAERRRSAAFRHLMWAVGILGSLTLPWVTLLLPAWHSATLGHAAGFWGPAHAVGASRGAQRWPSMIVEASADSRSFSKLPGLVLLLWAAGLLFVAMRLAAGLARLAWISAHSQPLIEDDWMHAVSAISKSLKITRPVRVLRSGNPVAMPVTWGIFRPVIMFPRVAPEWSEKRRRIVLYHELAHIARGDWFLQICAEIARGFYWFHPLAWIATRCLRQESERACDDFVLNSGIEPSDYANQLLDLARTFEDSHRAWSTALAFARPSNLERRFAAMLNRSIDRRRLSPRAKLLAIVTGLCLLLPLATLQLSGQNLSGKFKGTIYDPSAAAVPNATVIMTNRKANTIEMTTSDADGNFKFMALPAGEYEMKVLKRGFEEYKLPQVVLEPGRESSHSMTMKVGSITEEVNVVAEGTFKAPPGGTVGKPTRIRLGGDIQAPKLLNKIQPVYPAAAKAAGVEGTVILHAIIGTEGSPLSLRIVNTQVDPELARAAVEAVGRWRYNATLLNGDPIEVDTTVTVNFKLMP
jgi:TonB family protein